MKKNVIGTIGYSILLVIAGILMLILVFVGLIPVRPASGHVNDMGYPVQPIVNPPGCYEAGWMSAAECDDYYEQHPEELCRDYPYRCGGGVIDMPVDPGYPVETPEPWGYPVEPIKMGLPQWLTALLEWMK